MLQSESNFQQLVTWVAKWEQLSVASYLSCKIRATFSHSSCNRCKMRATLLLKSQQLQNKSNFQLHKLQNESSFQLLKLQNESSFQLLKLQNGELRRDTDREDRVTLSSSTTSNSIPSTTRKSRKNTRSINRPSLEKQRCTMHCVWYVVIII